MRCCRCLEATLGPGIVEALARTATLAREDADALDAWAERVWAQALGRATLETPTASDAPASTPTSTQAAPAGTRAPEFGGFLPQDEQDPSKFAERSPGAATVAGQPRPGGPIVLPIAALTTAREPIPLAIVHRVVRRLLIEAGCPVGSLTAGHIRAVAALLEPGASARAEVALPGGRLARREGGALIVRV